MSYIIRRAIFYLIAAWASITLNFFLPRMMPGDPGSVLMAKLRGQGDIRPETIEAMTKAYGLSDDPLIIQYFGYMRNILSGEFGVSTSWFPAPVIDVIRTGLIWTIILMGTALLISFGIGSVLGVIGAWKRGSWMDNVTPPVFVFLGSLPYFWIAPLLLFAFAFHFNIFPARHAYNTDLSPNFSWSFISSVIGHMILPVLSIVIVSIGGWLLGMRNTMIAILSEDYVTMAEAKGLGSRRVMFGYGARNALLPTLTSFGMSLGFILSGSLFTEMVFAYPGLGYLLINSVRSLDYPLMQGLFMMITFAVLFANFIIDILYVRLDPRIRQH
ncbi:MAG: ABC transporter permease [Thermomicrobiales bacterium]|nr:ABC transporter permease [Thermomicrobiales bacterium]MCO5219024.1 ABC transporter permease [Thermomicrobiales bacterium]MCO5225373.1 ABC transporter permease [Thermomicrobiales bacterium]MCO5227287.1 ABC transporter permease [Thermomicrobiales bacterium]